MVKNRCETLLRRDVDIVDKKGDGRVDACIWYCGRSMEFCVLPSSGCT